MAEKGENNQKSEAAKREERVLEFWKKNNVFQKTLDKNSPRGDFVFYEGPPTANAKPALHHLEARAFKDVIPRYKTMRGYHVRRKGGWDTHGLPVELQIEKKLGFKSKKDIEDYGIAAFNKLCKDSVWEYISLWKTFTDRIGYWADQENAYITYHNTYIESLWNIVKKINEQKLLYKDYKVVPWCPRCGTALSSHELAQGYEDDKDLAVTVKFKVADGADEKFSRVLGKNPQTAQKSSVSSVFILAWTTTPWTLPGNVALAVGENVDYVKIKVGNEILILAKARLSIITEPYEILEKLKGQDLIDLEYEPLYPFLQNTISEGEKPKLEKAFKIYLANFVNTEDGTGIVHTAVMYGQDDFVLGTKTGLPKHHLVNPEGRFIKGTGFLEERFVKDENVTVDIIKDLARRGLLFSKEKYEHSCPHCWRCHTALIYYARDSWYIKMSDPKIKRQLISENEKINWEPEHIRDGRFGEWLREVKDWAISRERYWGTPLPVWECRKCGKKEVIGSIGGLKEKTQKSGNKYFVMRHGEALDNAKHLDDPKGDPNNHLTDQGEEETVAAGKKLKNKKIDLIFSSPFLRTRETAEVLRRELGLKEKQSVLDDRLHEYNEGDKNLVAKRMGDFLYDVENEFQDKNIAIISHGNPIWTLQSIAAGLPHANFTEKQILNTGEVEELPFVPLPHNENYELDLHRPYIDEIKLICKCGNDLVRAKEVMDVWFDSGAMPFAQDHYPFENKEWVDGPGYPADFISEAIDQTRGWFYTLHAIGVLMGRGRAYKNVICLGHLMDAVGKKMSKSLGNIIDPWKVMDEYGVDTLRLWMYSINQPGESKNFDEKTVVLLHNQIFGLLYNVLAFYELYRDKKIEKNNEPKSKNILDVWILARSNELIKLSTENLDNYKLLEPVRGMRDFIGDLSTWYLRRSRERIKNGDEEAKQTLYFVLKTVAKIMAPFAPFAAEDIWLKLRTEKDEKSVHLTSWPEAGKVDKKIIEEMAKVREIVSVLLKDRQDKGIPVRQILSRATGPAVLDAYVEIIKQEINVKDYVGIGAYNLNTEITPALKAEGEYREFMRELQDRRKKLGLNPGDKMAMDIQTIYIKYKIMPNLQEHMLRVAAVASIICDNFNESLPKKEIITACLLHDIGNIIKFDLNYFPELLELEGLGYWQNVQDEYIKKYGKDEHQAALKIAKELQISDKIIELIDSISFLGSPKTALGNDYSQKIMEYCDDRVDPFGVVSLEQRFADLRKRYAHRSASEYGSSSEHHRNAFENALRQMEKQIFTKCKIKPEDINDKSVAPIIAELKKFIIK